MRFMVLLLWFVSLSAQAAEKVWKFGTLLMPPFGTVENNKVTGALTEIVKAACEHMRIHCDIQALPWRRAMQMIEAGTLDGAFPIAKRPEREQVFYLAHPAIETGYAIYAMKNSTFRYSGPRSLSGHVIAAFGPNSSTWMTLQSLISGIPDITPIVEVDNLTVLKKLSAGRYKNDGLAFINRHAALSLIEQNDITEVKWIVDVQSVQYFVGLSLKTVSPGQATAFQQALDELIKVGAVQPIFERYKLH